MNKRDGARKESESFTFDASHDISIIYSAKSLIQ